MSTKKREPHTVRTSHVVQASPAAHTRHTANGEGPSEKPAPVVPIVSDDERSRSIQIRAYGLWEQAGKPEGDAARVQFWFEAEKELTAARASS